MNTEFEVAELLAEHWRARLDYADDMDLNRDVPMTLHQLATSDFVYRCEMREACEKAYIVLRTEGIAETVNYCLGRVNEARYRLHQYRVTEIDGAERIGNLIDTHIAQYTVEAWEMLLDEAGERFRVVAA